MAARSLRVIDGFLNPSAVSGIHSLEDGIAEVVAKIRRISSVLARVVHIGVPETGTPFAEFIVPQGLVRLGRRDSGRHAEENGQRRSYELGHGGYRRLLQDKELVLRLGMRPVAGCRESRSSRPLGLWYI